MALPEPAPESALLSTQDAARLLAVKPATLYAYVSRGVLHSHRARSGAGPSQFDRAEVEALARQRGHRTMTPPVAPPSAEPALTTIGDDRLFYRGRDAAELARALSFEQVAEWLWGTTEDPAAPAPPWRSDDATLRRARAVQRALPDGMLLVDRLTVGVPVLAAADVLRLDLTPRAVAATARALLAGLVDSLPGLGPLPPSGACLADRLWARLTAQPPDSPSRPALNAALVLLADHGARPPATATARLAASLRSDPYAVVVAAMGVGSGAQHAGPFVTLQTMFANIAGPDDAVDVVGAHLRAGGDLRGFHPRQYVRVDPRAQLLLQLLAERLPDSPRLAGIQRVVDLVRERRGVEPSVEVAVAALAALADMRPWAGEAMFRIARGAGWLAHALQVYQQAPRPDLPSLLYY